MKATQTITLTAAVDSTTVMPMLPMKCIKAAATAVKVATDADCFQTPSTTEA